ncbi:MAG TPA: inositol monophosphatase family protein [Candidatus Saccharimonadales bacterium]|nr:inositol monophosphatase family protein [Candidatus Saccharimonadales bacterium]
MELYNDEASLSPETMAEAIGVMEEVLRQNAPVILSRAGATESTDKEDGSPVTETDREVEESIKAEFARHGIDIPVYGEEGGYDEHDLPETFWLVDPIDGTKSFIKGIPTFTSMAALIHKGETRAAILYNPSTDVMYTARKGQGAFRNGERLDLTGMPLSRVAYCKDRFIADLDELFSAKGLVCEEAPSGGGYGFMMVAEGKAGARFNLHSGGYVHDYAPGALLVSEAGGVLVPVLDDGYTYRTRSFVACHPALEQEVRRHIEALKRLEAQPKSSGQTAA